MMMMAQSITMNTGARLAGRAGAPPPARGSSPCATAGVRVGLRLERRASEPASWREEGDGRSERCRARSEARATIRSRRTTDRWFGGGAGSAVSGRSSRRRRRRRLVAAFGAWALGMFGVVFAIYWLFKPSPPSGEPGVLVFKIPTGGEPEYQAMMAAKEAAKEEARTRGRRHHRPLRRRRRRLRRRGRLRGR